MPMEMIRRRDFVRSILMTLPALAFDWSAFPMGALAQGKDDDNWDVVVIGSGLGGLTAAAAFARQGFKALVIEKHDRPGGYATCFKRPGGFEFDVSLHSTSVPEQNGVRYIPGFPEITDVEFVPHPSTFRGIFPDYDITVPQCNPDAFVAELKRLFPDETAGIDGVFKDMRGITTDVGKLQQAQGQIDYSKFPFDFPFLFKAYSRTWGQIVDGHVTNPKLKAIINAQCGYYGLPPSKLASIYYAMPFIGYLDNGGYYPKGRSQAISDAFVRFIENRGGKVLLKTKVEKILAKDGAAYGVATADGHKFMGKAIIANVNAYDAFHTLLPRDESLAEYMAKLDGYSVSLSSFCIWLGLKENLVGKLGLKDAEIFYEPSYDYEASYRAILEGRLGDSPGYGLMLYDNLYEGYSPPGKNTLSIITLMSYDHWKQYEADYWAGNKTAYNAEKERIADVLISQVEKTLMPGLRGAIEVKEIGTPLTNLRYTGNYRGAIYGWDQTLDNAMPNRLPQTTPVKNLYLSGAWTQPGAGYSAVIGSGLMCFAEIMKGWK
jgi:all-trans-retinol 13,14-reductase